MDSQKRKVIIDTDTGSDDAVALMMALLDDSVEVLGITTVCGNVETAQATQNALMTVEVCGRQTPVYEGCEKPLMRELVTAIRVHGDDGMGDMDLICPTQKKQPEHAVDYLLKTIREHPGEVEVIALGPMTNIALAMMKEPQTMRQVKHIYSMGTPGFGPGNTTPVASFNVYVDAESYRVLLQGGVPLTIIGFHLCLGEAALNRSDMDFLLAQNAVSKFAVECNTTLLAYNQKRTGEYMVDLPDAVAMAVALWDDVVEEQRSVYVHCCTENSETYGQTIYYDRTDVLAIELDIPPDNAVVIKKINHKLYKERLLRMLAAQ